MKKFWDEKFSVDGYLYGQKPNPEFKKFIDSNIAGKILLPGEGEGRNAVYAALSGWEVDAIDQSTIAKEKALSLALKYGVSINYSVGDIIKHGYEKQSYDAIALVFFHLPPEIRIPIHKQLSSLLKPKGKIFIVGFSEQQLNYTSGGPKNEEMLYTSNKLEDDFKEFRIVNNETILSSLNEGVGHQGDASLLVFEAIK